MEVLEKLKKRLECYEKRPQFNPIKDYWNWINEVEKEMR
jgi:hypothetical protein